MRKVIAAAFVIACSSLPAFADIEVPQSWTDDFVTPGANNPVFVQFVDGVYISSGNNTWPAGFVGSVTMSVRPQWADNFTVQIVMGATPADGVWQIDATYTAPGFSGNFNQVANPVFLTAQSGVNLLASGFVFVGTYDPTTALTLTLTFTNTGAIDSGVFQFDRVSNPEPGAIALFGLGALGLGGVAWKRRKLRKGAAKA